MSRRPPIKSKLEYDSALLEKLQALEELNKLHAGLPHLYKYKHYSWSRRFYESRNKFNLLCSANQVGKSSSQIRKFIEWATNKSLWPELWPGKKPNLFWYFYPTKEIATNEFETKWMEFMPAGSYKDSGDTSWVAEYDKEGFIAKIVFGSGVQIQYKSYSQKATNLQAATVYIIGCDEELPDHFYDELKFRLSATDGYFSMCFTATLGQQFWYDAIEEIGTSKERFPEANKIQVSLYDCLEYEDGSPSHWTKERIQRIIRDCKNDQEVQRRVFGRFIKSESQLFHGFHRKENVTAPFTIDTSRWNIYAGVDIGSGGESGHPAAIVFIAVSQDYKKGYVVDGWRGDKIRTTNGDIFQKYMEMKRRFPHTVACYYDFAAADFATIAARAGVPVLKAEKNHEKGLGMLNTLFKNHMLSIFDTFELNKLVGELLTVDEDVVKRGRQDDFTDALRYCVVGIPWDTSGIVELNKSEEAPLRILTVDEQRRSGTMEGESAYSTYVSQELEEWNELYG